MKKSIIYTLIILLNISALFYMQAFAQEETLEQAKQPEPRALIELCLPEVWQNIMEYLPGNDIFLNEALARKIEVTPKTFHNIITAFQSYLITQAHNSGKDKKIELVNLALKFFKTSKLPSNKNLLYHSFDDAREIFRSTKDTKPESILHYAIIQGFIYDKPLLNNWYREEINSNYLVYALRQREQIISLVQSLAQAIKQDDGYYLNKNNSITQTNLTYREYINMIYGMSIFFLIVNGIFPSPGAIFCILPVLFMKGIIKIDYLTHDALYNTLNNISLNSRNGLRLQIITERYLRQIKQNIEQINSAKKTTH